MHTMLTANQLLSEVASTELGSERPPPIRGDGPFAIGQLVGGTYRIDGLLGRGGMGTVYEATDCHLPRRVALKVPNHPAFSQALCNEAQALAAVRHAAFPAIHQFGYEGDTAYFAMERLYGEPLEARLRARQAASEPLTIIEVLDILIAIADALAAAHRVSVTHRDLKPSNILLSGERIMLIDLGLFIPEPLVGPDNLITGSLQSIAPEVVMQSVRRGRGPLIDLYALGALAYELLVGVAPYTGETTPIILAKHVCADVPDPRDARLDVPDDLARLVMSLLAKDPADRPSSSESVLWLLKEQRGDGSLHLHDANILVVDDDVSIGKAVRGLLEQSFPQLRVRATNDPAEALPGSGTMPDIVVLDLDMPRINGIEVCMALRSLPSDRRPAVIAMSGAARPEDVELLEQLGVRAFVAKDASLFQAIGNAIGSLRSGERASWTPPLRQP